MNRASFSPFQPPQFSYGAGVGRQVIMTVVNVQDPEQAGRVQVRIFGYQNDTANIPNADLLWARPVNSPTNPSNGGVGASPTGIQVGTTLVGYFADGNQQLFYTGSLSRAGQPQANSNSLNQGGRNHDVPPNARDRTTGGGDIRFDSRSSSFESHSLTLYGANESPNPYGVTTVRDGDEQQSLSIGTFQYS
jgi:hypothetical protein